MKKVTIIYKIILTVLLLSPITLFCLLLSILMYDERYWLMGGDIFNYLWLSSPDTVILLNDIGSYPKGTKGFILLEYGSGMYKVELFDENNSTIGLEVIHKDNLKII